MADKLCPLFFGSDLGLHFIVIGTHILLPYYTIWYLDNGW
jgi:hypothetical protein